MSQTLVKISIKQIKVINPNIRSQDDLNTTVKLNDQQTTVKSKGNVLSPLIFLFYVKPQSSLQFYIRSEKLYNIEQKQFYGKIQSKQLLHVSNKLVSITIVEKQKGEIVNQSAGIIDKLEIQPNYKLDGQLLIKIESLELADKIESLLKMDLFVQITVEDQSKSSNIKKGNKVISTWNQILDFKVKDLKSKAKVVIKDKSFFGDKIIGETEIPLRFMNKFRVSDEWIASQAKLLKKDQHAGLFKYSTQFRLINP